MDTRGRQTWSTGERGAARLHPHFVLRVAPQRFDEHSTHDGGGDGDGRRSNVRGVGGDGGEDGVQRDGQRRLHWAHALG
jgi:hypothetical protein